MSDAAKFWVVIGVLVLIVGAVAVVAHGVYRAFIEYLERDGEP